MPPFKVPTLDTNGFVRGDHLPVKVGTRAQRLAFATPTLGMTWRETDAGGDIWWYDGAAWVFERPTASVDYATASGSTTLSGTPVTLPFDASPTWSAGPSGLFTRAAKSSGHKLTINTAGLYEFSAAITTVSGTVSTNCLAYASNDTTVLASVSALGSAGSPAGQAYLPAGASITIEASTPASGSCRVAGLRVRRVRP